MENKPDVLDRNKPDAICVSCRNARVNGQWLDKKATEEEFRSLGRVICPECGPKNNG